MVLLVRPEDILGKAFKERGWTRPHHRNFSKKEGFSHVKGNLGSKTIYPYNKIFLSSYILIIQFILSKKGSGRSAPYGSGVQNRGWDMAATKSPGDLPLRGTAGRPYSFQIPCLADDDNILFLKNLPSVCRLTHCFINSQYPFWFFHTISHIPFRSIPRTTISWGWFFIDTQGKFPYSSRL